MTTSRLCPATAGTLLTCPPLQLNKAASHSGVQKPHLSPTSLPSFLPSLPLTHVSSTYTPLKWLLLFVSNAYQDPHFPNDCVIEYGKSCVLLYNIPS